ncbi:uncharacterized protein PAC_15694 [Phialocephala subalpina]|uniref:Uncharacterized protein n=1 Tax=Phialocephala subalpina TaxID=576137 RepID=A0A1L7XLA8_9HELO|nr:uncharacterized protein PAC_15694 [Phialocephala subalpina]
MPKEVISTAHAENGRPFTVKGRTRGTISFVTSSTIKNVRPDESLFLVDLLENLWRPLPEIITAINEGIEIVKGAPSNVAFDSTSIQPKTGRTFVSGTSLLDGRGETKIKEMWRELLPFVSNIHQKRNVHNHVLFLGRGGGIGLAPDNTEVGDILCKFNSNTRDIWRLRGYLGQNTYWLAGNCFYTLFICKFLLYDLTRFLRLKFIHPPTKKDMEHYNKTISTQQQTSEAESTNTHGAPAPLSEAKLNSREVQPVSPAPLHRNGLDEAFISWEELGAHLEYSG